MKCRRIITILAILSACAGATFALAEEGTDPAAAESCLACHQGPLSLKEQATEALLAEMKAIREGSATHPVKFPELSDEELAAIARALTAK